MASVETSTPTMTCATSLSNLDCGVLCCGEARDYGTETWLEEPLKTSSDAESVCV